MGRYAPELEKFVKSRLIQVPTSDDLFCWDHCAVMNQANEQNVKMFSENIYTTGRKNAYRRIFNKEPNTNSKEYRDFIKSYEGFTIATDMEGYCNYYKVNVSLFAYQNEKYFLQQEFVYNESYKMINILVHSFHAMLIKNQNAVERLTEIVFCKECFQPIGKSKDPHLARKKRNHEKECAGKAGAKKMKKPKEDVYLPHIFKNRAYAYCLAHSIEYQPIRYYITYDFETVEEHKQTPLTQATMINSYLHPLSVASTIKSKSGIQTIYYDLRSGSNFITKWIEKLFILADAMKEDNLIENVPLENQLKNNTYTITVLGYNSSRFDMNLLLKYLDSDSWHIDSVLGSSTKFKQVLVNQKRENYTIQLRFIDAMNLAGSLAIAMR